MEITGNHTLGHGPEQHSALRLCASGTARTILDPAVNVAGARLRDHETGMPQQDPCLSRPYQFRRIACEAIRLYPLLAQDVLV